MSTNDRKLTAIEKIKQAEDVRDELCAALHDARITLPSLRVDPVGCADEKPRLLVELGRCNLQTARQLADVIRIGNAGRWRQVGSSAGNWGR